MRSTYSYLIYALVDPWFWPGVWSGGDYQYSYSNNWGFSLWERPDFGSSLVGESYRGVHWEQRTYKICSQLCPCETSWFTFHTLLQNTLTLQHGWDTITGPLRGGTSPRPPPPPHTHLALFWSLLECRFSWGKCPTPYSDHRVGWGGDNPQTGYLWVYHLYRCYRIDCNIQVTWDSWGGGTGPPTKTRP